MTKRTTKLSYEEQRYQKDVAFAKDPLQWPHWPVLPVARLNHQAHENDHVGLIWASHKAEVILSANMFSLGEIPGDTWEEKLRGFQRKEYSSFEALFKEWRVD